jgi:hypothetical protein
MSLNTDSGTLSVLLASHEPYTFQPLKFSPDWRLAPSIGQPFTLPTENGS